MLPVAAYVYRERLEAGMIGVNIFNESFDEKSGM